MSEARSVSDPTATGFAVPTKRLRSLDVARGLVVAASAAMSHLPEGGFEWARHARWYGLQGLDLVFPAFMTLFGAGIAIAYRDRVPWRRVVRRTVVLVALGLVFNAVIAWSVDPDTWRFTGVLQQFAVAGLVVILLTRAFREWWQATVVAAVLLVAHLLVTLGLSAACADGLPQIGCNPSLVIDPAVFGESHIYSGGSRGYEPEGLVTLFGQVPNVLLGYAGGSLLWRYRSTGAGPALLALAVGLAVAALVVALPLPIAKRPWTPGFALVTAAVAIGLLAVMHVAVDRLPRHAPRATATLVAATWLPEAFGRNSLLIYFGKYVVVSVLAHITLQVSAQDRSLADLLLAWVDAWSPAPQVTYAALMVAAWAAVAAVLHARRRYITA